MYFVISNLPCLEDRFPAFKIVDKEKVMGFGYGPFIKLSRAKAWHKEVGLDKIDVGPPFVKMEDIPIMFPPCTKISIEELKSKLKRKGLIK